MEKKLQQLERGLKQNEERVKKIEKSVSDLLKGSNIIRRVENKIDQHQPSSRDKTKSSGYKLTSGKTETNDCCEFSESSPITADIQMLDIYEKTDFANQDGGVWKQGWDVQYNASRFTLADTLKVFVVPHSHNDPGWIKTFEQYYEEQTRYCASCTVIYRIQLTVIIEKLIILRILDNLSLGTF